MNALSVQDSQRAWARVNFPSPSVLTLLSETNATSVHFVLIRDFSYRKAPRFACLLSASLLSIPRSSTGVPGTLRLNMLNRVHRSLQIYFKGSYISAQVAPAQGSKSRHCTLTGAPLARLDEQLSTVTSFCCLSFPFLLLPPKLCFHCFFCHLHHGHSGFLPCQHRS